ncbi:MAG: hypothetical protein J6I41_06170 [Bacteroidales bacterium]|nr:hypothetical protein [Bacteroidales bacterium]
MKRILLLMLLPAVLAVGCSREADLPPAGALYRQYAARQELKVAQLSGYKLCDTVRVDVVMLQADGEEEWRQLAEEFGLRGTEGSESWLGEVDNPAQRTAWDGKAVMRVIASHTQRTIGFYRIDDETQYDALLDYQLNKLLNEN